MLLRFVVSGDKLYYLTKECVEAAKSSGKFLGSLQSNELPIYWYYKIPQNIMAIQGSMDIDTKFISLELGATDVKLLKVDLSKIDKLVEPLQKLNDFQYLFDLVEEDLNEIVGDTPKILTPEWRAGLLAQGVSAQEIDDYVELWKSRKNLARDYSQMVACRNGDFLFDIQVGLATCSDAVKLSGHSTVVATHRALILATQNSRAVLRDESMAIICDDASAIFDSKGFLICNNRAKVFSYIPYNPAVHKIHDNAVFYDLTSGKTYGR